MMRMLPLASVRETFGWALLWSTLLASFAVQGGSAVLYNIALCGNIIISILQFVEEYFPGWYHFVTYLDNSWTSKVQDYPHFSLKWGSEDRIVVFYVCDVKVFFDYLATNFYGCMGSVVDH